MGNSSRPEGREGVPGATGIGGSMGPVGELGISGVGGLTTPWTGGKAKCSDASTETMRLTHCNGLGCRLDLFFAGEWGTVCSKGWGRDSANTMCRAFGFPEGGSVDKAYGGGYRSREGHFPDEPAFRPTKIWLDGVDCTVFRPTKIWLDGVDCTGTEGDAGDCPHGAWDDSAHCNHDEDVGLCCWGFQTGSLGRRESSSSFTNCPRASTEWAKLTDCDKDACRLEIVHDEEWGTVCDDGFEDASAGVVCRSLGFTQGGIARRATAKGKGPIWLDGATLLQGSRDPLRKGGGIARRATAKGKGPIWLDGGGIARRATTKGKGPIWLDGVRCRGFEKNMELCPHNPWAQ
ncbi:hypothetical protein T484DRAFT_1815426, partial [Baffinella frigidus]